MPTPLGSCSPSLVPSFASLACIAVSTIALVASTAFAQAVCTTSDGRVHAGTLLPRDCTVKEKYRGLVNPGEALPDPATSAALARQAEIRSEASAKARELRAIEARLAAVPEFDPAPYANDPPGWRAYDRDLAAHAAGIERLRRRQSELRWQLESLKRELAGLTARSR